MSDTPETDAAAFDPFAGQGGEVVDADFSRNLERERNEALKIAQDLSIAANHCLGWQDCRLKIGEKTAAALERWRNHQEAAK